MKIAWGLILAAAGLHAQVTVYGGRAGDVGGWAQPFQQVVTLQSAFGGGVNGGLYEFSNSSRNAVLVGRPFSATEQRTSLQTLGDGTEISSSSSTLISRDGQGRTRTEPDSPNAMLAAAGVKGPASVEITDPVSGHSITLNPVNKVARIVPMPIAVQPEFIARAQTTLSDAGGMATAGRGGRGGRGGANDTMAEKLGTQLLNGVLATGKRTTLVIPQGTIGNNRAIHVVNERWYSEDLQMLVKTVNSDPRFGTDTYELVNISRTEPDPALFQIPAGYTMVTSEGRGGRGRGGR